MLFKTTEEFKQYVPVNVNFTLDQIAPYCRKVERDLLSANSCMGAEQYLVLHAAYISATDLTAAQAALLPYTQEVVACFAFVGWIAAGQLDISDVGIRINSNESQKTAFQWQIEDLKAEWIANGYSAQEALLKFMKDNSADYTTWTGSNAYTVYKAFLFSGAEDFNTYFNIQSSRRTYAALANQMRIVEAMYIAPTISAAYLSELKVKFHGSTLLAEDTAILFDLKSAIAHLVMNHATKSLPVEVAGDGIVINSFIATYGTIKQKEPATVALLKRLEQESQILGNSFLSKVRDTLNTEATASVYATYFGSGLYDDPAAEGDDRNEWVNGEDFGQVVI